MERTLDELIELVRNDETWNFPEGMEGFEFLKEVLLKTIYWDLTIQ